MIKYTQTTTADEPKEPQMPEDRYEDIKVFPKWTVFILGIIVLTLILLLAYRTGKSQGRSEAEQEALKQEQHKTRSQIKTIDEQNKDKATEVRNESQKDREQAKIIRDNAFVPMPEFKTSSQDTMIKYLKEARP